MASYSRFGCSNSMMICPSSSTVTESVSSDVEVDHEDSQPDVRLPSQLSSLTALFDRPLPPPTTSTMSIFCKSKSH
ncbi:unnamed protein product [Amoebophrya sp. A25]|nr:unnamed protein product [Amoebophrya sp. A25]|eukprot:GSA25T00007278001.1